MYQIPGLSTALGARGEARRESGFAAQGERFNAMAIEMAFVVAAAHAALKAQVARINALNVYPVPDGDTGTNMLLTLESILQETSDKTYDTPKAARGRGGTRGSSFRR